MEKLIPCSTCGYQPEVYVKSSCGTRFMLMEVHCAQCCKELKIFLTASRSATVDAILEGRDKVVHLWNKINDEEEDNQSKNDRW